MKPRYRWVPYRMPRRAGFGPRRVGPAYRGDLPAPAGRWVWIPGTGTGSPHPAVLRVRQR